MSRLKLEPSYDITIAGMAGSLGKIIKGSDNRFVFQPLPDTTYNALIMEQITITLNQLNGLD